MQRYKNLEGDSGVSAYEIGNEFIKVQFNSGSIYTYTYSYRSAGVNNVDRMKNLATHGQGLNSFIMNNVKDNYEK